MRTPFCGRGERAVSGVVEEQDASEGVARVTVKVSGNKDQFPRDGKRVEVSTGVSDLRVFRDGQLVQQKIGPIGNGPVVGVFVIAVGALGVNVGTGKSTKSGGTNEHRNVGRTAAPKTIENLPS